MFKAKFKPMPPAKPQAQQQQQPQQPKVPPIEEERGPQHPVREPEPRNPPERARKERVS
ncbi:MAG TPA: hypothetical protein VHL79_23095 [Ramlibacter sp.]|nr:hypothetical protein [Ramlibacter sp.]